MSKAAITPALYGPVTAAVEAVCARHSITLAQIMERTRRIEIIAARADAFKALRFDLGLSLPEIAGVFGMDHTSVHHILQAANAGREFIPKAYKDIRARREAKLQKAEQKAQKVTSIREAIRTGFDQGKTRRQIATELRIDYRAVFYYSKDMPFPCARAENNKDKIDHTRSNDMLKRYQGGDTLEKIGADYSITRERVRQILRKNFNVTGVDGGQAKVVAEKRASANAKLDAHYRETLGCTRAEWMAVPNYYRLKYSAHKRKAIRLHKTEWLLKPFEWWNLFVAAGAVPGRQWWLSRIDRSLPFTVENTYVAKASEVVWTRQVSKVRVKRERQQREKIIRVRPPECRVLASGKTIYSDAMIGAIVAAKGVKSAREIAIKHDMTRNQVIGIWFRHAKPAEQSA